MLLEEVLGAWNSFLCSGKLPPSLCFANYAFLLNRCFGNRGRIIKYLLCQKVDLCCSTLSINQMFLPRKSPLKIQLDYNYCTFALIDVESSLPFWLLPSSFSAYRATKLIRNRRKGSWVAPKWERRNPKSQMQMCYKAGASPCQCLAVPDSRRAPVLTSCGKGGMTTGSSLKHDILYHTSQSCADIKYLILGIIPANVPG